jgi:DNA polymerase-4/DNA polymerase V
MQERRKDKCFFHMDGDAFFVACEVAKNPSLKGLPAVTGEERGIVSALSYEAKALGIKRGMPIFKLKKEFPEVLILPGDYKTYAEFSKKMFDVVRRYADVVEEYSIDECFADLTGLERPLKLTYKQIAQKIKDEVTNELGLSVSLGIAPTKALSKVASKFQKPNGLTEITKETIKDFLKVTPIGKIWGIGPNTSRFLELRGVKTALDFVEKDFGWVKENLSKPFQVIWHELSGTAIMQIDGEAKTSYDSMQKTRTFYPPTAESDFLLSQLSKNLEEVCRKARYYKLVPKKISFFLKTQKFRYLWYEVDLEIPTNTPEILLSLIHKHFRKVFHRMEVYRATGVTLLELSPEPLRQLDLFGKSERAKKFEIIYRQIDLLEEKIGKKAVYLGSTHKAKSQKAKGTDAEDLDRDLLFL